MAEITASMVKELRERTDAPMMDCKKALTEAVGDALATRPPRAPAALPPKALWRSTSAPTARPPQ